MKVEEVLTVLEEVGVPVVYMQFNKDSVNPPFITFMSPRTDNFYADNEVYAECPNYIVFLATDKKDVELERKFKSVLNAHEITWEHTGEVFIKEQNILQNTYEFMEVENG